MPFSRKTKKMVWVDVSPGDSAPPGAKPIWRDVWENGHSVKHFGYWKEYAGTSNDRGEYGDHLPKKWNDSRTPDKPSQFFPLDVDLGDTGHLASFKMQEFATVEFWLDGSIDLLVGQVSAKNMPVLMFVTPNNNKYLAGEHPGLLEPGEIADAQEMAAALALYTLTEIQRHRH